MLHQNRLLKIFAPILLSTTLMASEPPPSASDPLDYYQNRYLLKNPYDKLIDNHGNGYESLYGLRNFRAVLNGIVYRGGANNAYNKHQKRNNQNPLPTEGLTHLCEEGFGTAVYLYTTNYKTAPKLTSCQSVFHQKQTLNYLQESPHLSDQASHNVLSLIYNRLISTTDHQPIYLHCWNGWHASGLISAYVLRQFCDYTEDEAINYWNRNTDGVNQGKVYDRLRAKIRAFKPDPSMTIDRALQEKICPHRQEI